MRKRERGREKKRDREREEKPRWRVFQEKITAKLIIKVSMAVEERRLFTA